MFIIAVTGLAGHAFGSWRSRKSGKMWLRDFIPEDLQENLLNARVLTYGYDTKLAGSKSNAYIDDFAKQFLEAVTDARHKDPRRPIIFIGHSLGGLVIKQALINADDDTLRSCYGIFFFGVPNKGLENTHLIPMVDGQPNSHLVNDLCGESQYLALLDQTFCPKFKFEDSKIISIYETMDTKTVGVIRARFAKDHEHPEIIRWLSIFDHEAKHRRASKLKQDGTGEWLLNGDSFGGWLYKDDRFLWLHGIAGAGKTILASTVINEVKRHCKDSPQTLGLAFFYCDFGDSISLDPEIIFGSLLAQLATQTKAFTKAVHDKYEQMFDRSTGVAKKLFLDDFVPLLLAVVDELEGTYVVIDGLDECPEREELLENLVNLAAPNNVKLHLLFTSREELDIKRKFEGKPSLCIQNRAVAHDVGLHVQSEMEKIWILKALSPRTKSEIVEILVNGAQGMFRWVQCQLDTLRHARTLKAMKRILSDLPKGLDKTYERTLSMIEDKEAARRILLWLICSESPMTIIQLAEAIIIEPDMNELDLDTRLLDYEHISEMCAGLITIDRIDDKPTIVRLAHYSVKEYLLSSRIQGSQFSINKLNGHRELATLCLTYLSLDNFGSPRESWDDVEILFESYPMLSYSCLNWGNHTRKGLINANDNPNWYKKLFVIQAGKDRDTFETFSQIYDWNWAACSHLGAEPTEDIKSPTEPLYYLAEAGVVPLVQDMLAGGADANSCGRRYGSALQAAAFHGHEEVIGLLLNHGADVNLNGGYWANALHAAIIQGHMKVVQRLLESGADIDREASFWHFEPHYGQDVDRDRTPLRTAAMQGDLEIVRLLLDKGASVESRGTSGETALLVAARYGRGAVVDLLLRRGCNVNAEGDNVYGNALNAAASFDNQETIRLLLEKGAHIHHECGEFGSALSNAAASGSLETVKLLLENGARFDASAGEYGSVLGCAARFAGIEVVKQLMRDGVVRGSRFGGHLAVIATAVIAAAAHGGDPEVVKFFHNFSLAPDFHWDSSFAVYILASMAESNGGPRYRRSLYSLLLGWEAGKKFYLRELARKGIAY
ncbi:hypothetical protein Q9L58_008574 [Maublancomyces gigas]|uniref:NACHT domain-containing protein n=1 Tax=Discina gigas TaxID=1032678 RepID=A0ABR3G9L5_9PEZI